MRTRMLKSSFSLNTISNSAVSAEQVGVSIRAFPSARGNKIRKYMITTDRWAMKDLSAVKQWSPPVYSLCKHMQWWFTVNKATSSFRNTFSYCNNSIMMVLGTIYIYIYIYIELQIQQLFCFYIVILANILIIEEHVTILAIIFQTRVITFD